MLERLRRLFVAYDPIPAPDTISAEAAAVLRKRTQCMHCGGWHQRPEPSCYRIRRIVFQDNGNMREVEYWPAGDWPTDHIIFPEDLPPEESE